MLQKKIVELELELVKTSSQGPKPLLSNQVFFNVLSPLFQIEMLEAVRPPSPPSLSRRPTEVELGKGIN
jgi:hypothetical protein